jgi:LAO/AO transport system kinase
MKRGILEHGDLVVVNKADGEDRSRAERARAELEGAFQLFQTASGAAPPAVLLVSALEERGVDELYRSARKLVEEAKANGTFAERRAASARSWLRQELGEALRARLLAAPGALERYRELESDVASGKILPRRAVSELLGPA